MCGAKRDAGAAARACTLDHFRQKGAADARPKADRLLGTGVAATHAKDAGAGQALIGNGGDMGLGCAGQSLTTLR